MYIQKTQAHQSQPAFKKLVLTEGIEVGSKLHNAIKYAYSAKTTPRAEQVAKILTQRDVAFCKADDGKIAVVAMADSALSYAFNITDYKSDKSLAKGIRRFILNMAAKSKTANS